MPKLNNILDAIGNTPLVRLKRMVPEGAGEVYAKLEFMNPGGSIKDRMARYIIEDAERRGELKSGMIVENTSGNTGVGVAIVAAVKGYKAIFTIPDKMSDEKINLLKAGGIVLERVALITGGSRGLGLATAKELQARGFRLLLVGLETQLTQNALRILTDRPVVKYISGDITKFGTCIEATRTCQEVFGCLDVLVNNAGMYLGGNIEEFPESSWDQIIGVNLTSHFLMTKAATPLLKESQGQIIFINSVGGKQGQANNSAYCASKFGLQGLADSIRIELKPFKIRVTSIFPNNMNSVGEIISSGDPKRLQLLETADVARLIGDVADAPAYAQIPEIQIYPLSTEISKSERSRFQ